MNCFWCKADAGRVGSDTKAVLCGTCIQTLTGPPQIAPPQPKLSIEEKAAKKAAKVAKKTAKLEQLKTATRGKGRGWHLKKLFEFEGSYFSMGKEIDPAQAAKIRKLLAKEVPVLPAVAKRGRGRPRKVSVS